MRNEKYLTFILTTSCNIEKYVLKDSPQALLIQMFSGPLPVRIALIDKTFATLLMLFLLGQMTAVCSNDFSYMNNDCLFCKIINRQIPSELVHEDEHCVAFNDISPQAPTHILLVPKTHFASLADSNETHKSVLGHILVTAAEIAREKGFSNDGYRVVINTNEAGGQTVFHLHVHLLGGRSFVFPPG